MELCEEYVKDLLSQKEKEGKLPDLGPDTKKLMVDMMTEIFEVFQGVSQEEIIVTLRTLKEILAALDRGKEQ